MLASHRHANRFGSRAALWKGYIRLSNSIHKPVLAISVPTSSFVLKSSPCTCFKEVLGPRWRRVLLEKDGRDGSVQRHSDCGCAVSGAQASRSAETKTRI